MKQSRNKKVFAEDSCFRIPLVIFSQDQEGLLEKSLLLFLKALVLCYWRDVNTNEFLWIYQKSGEDFPEEHDITKGTISRQLKDDEIDKNPGVPR